MRIEVVVPYTRRDILEDAFLRSQGLGPANLVLLENGVRPRGLPTLFNSHKRAAAADWLVFCHQDFVVNEDRWIERIGALSPDACYGPIGISARGVLLGRVRQTDGSMLGKSVDLAEVVTLDEVCLIVPQSIFSVVDFDPRFPFDFYAHDYCLQARRAGFTVRTFQVDCQHRSKTLLGNLDSEHFRSAKQSFLEKYAGERPLLTTSFCIFR